MRTSNLIAGIGNKITSNEDLKNFMPAVFTTGHDPKRSERYSFVDSNEILNLFKKFGWTPYSGKQDGTSPFSRHIVRLQSFNFVNVPFNVDDVRPQIIFDNSHNGASYAQIHLGLMRKVCGNGLVVNVPGMSDIIRFRHMGVNAEELKKTLDTIAEHYAIVATHIADMQKMVLTEDQKKDFVIKATAYREPDRFLNEDKSINVDKVLKTVKTEDILVPLRDEDKVDNLWTTFNVIQEKFVRGEYHRTSDSGRKAKPRGIFNANRGITYNKALWKLAEEYLAVAAN
jgi:hypothetical protein